MWRRSTDETTKNCEAGDGWTTAECWEHGTEHSVPINKILDDICIILEDGQPSSAITLRNEPADQNGTVGTALSPSRDWSDSSQITNHNFAVVPCEKFEIET